MNDLDRIEHELQHGKLNHDVFERFAQDQLSAVYPGFTPIPGGTDWGRDGDVPAASGDATPARVLITASRTLDGVRANMLRGIKSMNRHGVAVDRIVLANPAHLNLPSREKLARSALKAGARLDASDVFERGFFASRLRRDGYWRERLLGLSSEPISLARAAPEVAESPWGHIPLVARNEDLDALDGADDLIVVGQSGVGKSRLLGEIEGVAFVDPELASEQLVKDLRWLGPATVVVDDASRHIDIVRRLVALRRAEPDVFRYRMICATWPGQLDGLTVELPEASVHEIGLIERGPMDQLLRSMGLSGGLARAEIMGQAEGRPGWAVALADPLLRSGEVTSLMNGRALLGNVRRYLMRAGLETETMDLFAVISAVGSVSEDELAALADEVGLNRVEAIREIERWARGGLVDVREHRERRDRVTRRFTVRPPMLARVLVAERVFDNQFSVIDFEGLAERWPDRGFRLAEVAIDSALLGSSAARPSAKQLAVKMLTSEDGSVDERVELAVSYSRLGPSAATFAMDLARSSFVSALSSGSYQPWLFDSVVKLAAAVAKWYPTMDKAYGILFDACGLDHRPPHSHPESAIRQIAALVQDYHPEVPRDAETRYAVLSALESWQSAPPENTNAGRVVAAVAEAILDLTVDGAHTDPANPMSIQLFRGIVPPSEMRRICDDAVPRLIALLDAGYSDLEIALIDAAREWLRVGSGFERSFGREPPKEEMAAASEIGFSLARQLMARSDLSLAGILKLRSLIDSFELPDSVDIPADIEPLVRESSYASSDFEAEERALVEEIRSVGGSWADEPCDRVIQRLVLLRAELNRANLTWPNRIAIACEGIAASTASPVQWLDEAMNSELMPDGFVFAHLAYERGQLDDGRLDRLLNDGRTRHAALSLLLRSDLESADRILEVLRPSDYQALWLPCLRGELDEQLMNELLTSASNEVRAMAAVAFFAGRQRKKDWSPGALQAAWLEALWHLEPGQLDVAREHELEQLLGYLAVRFPNVLVGIVDRAVRSGLESEGGVHSALPRRGWDQLQYLPPESKSELRNGFKDSGLASWMLNQHLVGSDVAWLEHAIDRGEMSVDEAISYCGGLSNRPPVEALARALVPRGAAPEQIAGVMEWGSFTGERSDHYQSMINELEELVDGDGVEDSVRAVAEVGIAGFSRARDEASASERESRIRGER